MSKRMRRWPILVLLLAVGGCGATRAVTRHAEPASGQAVPGSPTELRSVTFDRSPWHTDFAHHAVPLTSIVAGGPPRDGIPPIDHPRYVSIAAAARFLAPREPVIAVQAGGRARAYPLQILVWHEIINDTLAGVPLAVTYARSVTAQSRSIAVPPVERSRSAPRAICATRTGDVGSPDPELVATVLRPGDRWLPHGNAADRA